MYIYGSSLLLLQQQQTRARSSCCSATAMTMGMTNQASGHGPSGGLRPHFLLVPLMAQGHIIPMTDMARLLAEQDAFVSFITTPVNASRMASIIDGVRASSLPIEFVELHFPSAEVGLPEGCENVDMITDQDLFRNFMDACAMLKGQLMAYLRGQCQQLPCCIISDTTQWWTGDVAREIGVPRLTFSGFCAFSSLCRYIIREHNIFENVSDENELVAFPGFPTRLEMTKATAPGNFNAVGMPEIRERMHEEDMRCDGVVMNTFDELEALFVDSFQQTIGKKVWTVGPMSLCNRDINAMASRGNKASIDQRGCLEWLDSMAPGSVILVSFGSMACTAPAQLVEIGLGLEASQRPFIWVIKAGKKFPEVEEWLAEGFEERVNARGLIIRGWAPQVMILSHPAIGGFMTHCGWNSTIEGICAGVPMITWPHFSEQFLNEKVVVDVLKVGVTIGAKKVTHWTVEQNEAMVTRDDVEGAVSKLMDDGKHAEVMRMRAKDLGAKARKALEQGGSSYNNIRLLIEETGSKKRLE